MAIAVLAAAAAKAPPPPPALITGTATLTPSSGGTPCGQATVTITKFGGPGGPATGTLTLTATGSKWAYPLGLADDVPEPGRLHPSCQGLLQRHRARRLRRGDLGGHRAVRHRRPRGFPTTPEYVLRTGLGSPKAYEFVHDLAEIAP